MTTETRRYTPEDLLCMPDGDHFELVDGDLVERSMSTESDILGLQLGFLIAAWNQVERLGYVFGAQAGLQIFPWELGLVRYADGGFLRFEKGVRPGPGHFRVAPDLVFEVTSPNDNFAAVERKVGEYIRAGVRLVWVIVPEMRWAHIYRPDHSTSLVLEAGELDGEDVLPGFRCRLSQVFAALEDR